MIFFFGKHILLALALALLFEPAVPLAPNFDSHYGIVSNPFHTLAAERATGDVFFQGMLSAGVLKQNSFAVFSQKGSGKTAARLHLKKITPSNRFVVELDNNPVQKGLQNFIGNFRAASNGPWFENNSKITDSKVIEDFWLEDDFAELLLSQLVARFLSSAPPLRTSIDALQKTPNLREILISLCLFYRGPSARLNNYVNTLVGNTGFFGLDFLSLTPGAGFQDIQSTEKKIRIMPIDKESASAKILFGALKYVSLAIPRDTLDPFQLLSMFSLFLKENYDLKPLFIVDSLDENRYFLGSQNIGGLKKFVLSCLGDRMQAILLGANLDLSMFFPDLPDLSPPRGFRSDKIPWIVLKWDCELLQTYAEFIMGYLRKEQKCSFIFFCYPPLPSFKELVHLPKTRELICQIPNPRYLHIFMQSLFLQLDNVAPAREQPFVSTREDVVKAFGEYQKTIKSGGIGAPQQEAISMEKSSDEL